MTSTVFISARDMSFSCESNERILDAAERAGYTMPYSCRKGVCETCRCLLSKGSVSMGPFGSRKHAGETILPCMATAEGAIECTPAWIEKRPAVDRTRVEALVHQITARSPSVSVLRLRLPIGRRARFIAGQYVSVLLEDGQSRNYSIANPPHLSDVIHLHVRRVPGGQFSDAALRTLAPGDHLEIELPFGLLGWTEERVRPAILLATGTGFAPLKSMIESLIHRGMTRPVHLFWGGERREDIYESALVKKWCETLSWFRFTAVLASPDRGWDRPAGFVQNEVAAQYDDLSDHEIYACGNPSMIGQAKALFIRERGLSPADFYSDAFVPSAAGPPPNSDHTDSSRRHSVSGNELSEDL